MPKGDYQKTYWPFWEKKWKEARQNYLVQAHTKEKEVKGYGDRQWFDLDGTKIYMLDHLIHIRNYRRYFLSNIISSD